MVTGNWQPRSPLAVYAHFLPVPPAASLVTLGEGWTPLVRSSWIGPRLGIANLWFKLEQTNPTGSYKDRFAACEVSLRQAQGHSVCVATSSGNTGSALAAYCARAGMRCIVFLSEQTPDGKLTQMRAYGAALFRVRGFGVSVQSSAEAFKTLSEVSTVQGIPLVISAYAYCPDGMEGVKTIAFEVAEQLAAMPGHVFVPIGGGGLCTALARGFADLARADTGRSTVPRLHAVQPAGNDTMVTSWCQGREEARAVESHTQISGLAVPTDIDATRALRAVRSTGGSGVLVDDSFVWEVQRDLCRHEGIYVEPAGAVSVAGLWRSVLERGFQTDEAVVCVLTGHGFKDPAAAERLADTGSVSLIDPGAIASAIGDATNTSTHS